MAKRARPPAPGADAGASTDRQRAAGAGASKARGGDGGTHPPVAGRPSAEAIAAFEKALEAIQCHEYERGLDAFSALADSYPTERALLDRVQMYIALCRRELKAKTPLTLEERMTAATAALNDDDDGKAEELARAIVAEEPRHDLALYLLAAVEARRGAPDEALGFLRQAISISPEAGAQARLDPDFEPLRTYDAFRRLTDLPAEPD